MTTVAAKEKQLESGLNRQILNKQWRKERFGKPRVRKELVEEILLAIIAPN